MSGDARTTIIFDGRADGAVSAADEVAEAVSEASGEMRQMAQQSAAVARGMISASAVMGAAKAAAAAFGKGMRELIASSEQLQEVQSALRQTYMEVRNAVGEGIITQKEAEVVSGTLAAMTREVAEALRGARDEQRDYSSQLATFALDVGLAAVRVVGLISTGYAGIRIAVLAAQGALELAINAVRTMTLAFLELEQRGIRAVSQALGDFAALAGPAIGAVFGPEVRASMDAFAQRQIAVRDSSERATASIREQQAASRETAESIRREYSTAINDALTAEMRRGEQIEGLVDSLGDLRARIADGSIAEEAFGRAIESTTGSIVRQRAAVLDLTAAAIEAEKARGELARLRETNELAKNQLVADEAMRLQTEMDAFAQAMATKDLERQISQTQSIKAAIAERTQAEQEAAAIRLSISQREAGTAARIAAGAVAQQGKIADNFRLGIARELEARAIQWAIEAGGRFAAFDFAGGAAFTAASASAAVGARLLGGSPSASGSVGAAASTTTNVTNQNTTIVNATGIIDRPVVEQVARAVGQAREQGMI